MTNNGKKLNHIGAIASMRLDIIKTLRAVAANVKHPAHKQIVLDLTTKLGLTNKPDRYILPADPNGFVLRFSTLPKNGSGHLRTQCEFQVISMLIMYFWLFCQTDDVQDRRSTWRYLSWLKRYAEDHKLYEVCGDIRKGFWLCNTSILKHGETPSLPQWLRDDGGETV